MKIKSKHGIEISEADGSALTSGSFFYWDAHLANIFLCEANRYCPDARFEQSKEDVKKFKTLFYKNSERGTELCGISKDITNKRVKIPEADLDDFISKIDLIHQKSEKEGIPSDNAFFMRNFVVPNPLQMKSAWRVTTDFSRRLLVLWGYAPADNEAVILPLTPTSAKWNDASRRVDLKRRISDMGLLSKYKFNWRKLFNWLFIMLLLAALISLIVAGCNAFSSRKRSGGGLPPKNTHGQTEERRNGSKPKDFDNRENEIPPKEGDAIASGVPSPNNVSEVLPTPIEEVSKGNKKIIPEEPPQEQNTTKEPSETKEKEDVIPKSETGEKKKENNNNEIAKDKAKTCPECNEEVKDGVCSNRCDKCGEHLNENKKCPNVCSECSEHFENGKCKNLCDECGSHKKDGICPNTCDKEHERLHKKNGLCPKCDKIIESVEFVVTLEDEKKEDEIYFPTFVLETSHKLSDNSAIRWFVNNKANGQGKIFVPKNGFSANNEYKVQAKISYSENGVLKEGMSNVYVWKKNVNPAAIERHIGIVGESRSDKNGRYYVLKVFSNPEEEVSSINWNVSLDGQCIKTEVENNLHNATRLYISRIPDEGKIKVHARTKSNDNSEHNVEGTFVYKAEILTANNSFDVRNSERGVALKHLVTPAIFLCLAEKGCGTAFGVTEKDLITNYHVIDGSESKGKVLIYNKLFDDAVEANIVAFSKENDLAWLRVEKDIDLPYLPIGNSESKKGDAVAAFGFPYSAVSLPDYKQSIVNVTFGEIEDADSSVGVLCHNADIYSGNSGGPLVAMDGTVIGINTLVLFENRRGNVANQNGVALSVNKIRACFPNLEIK